MCGTGEGKTIGIKNRSIVTGDWRWETSGAVGNFLYLNCGSGYTTVSHSTCAHLCLTLCDPTDCSLPGSSVYGILQTRILEWAALQKTHGIIHKNGLILLCKLFTM